LVSALSPGEHRRRSGLQPGKQQRDRFGRILQIRVHHHHMLAAGECQAHHIRTPLPNILVQSESGHVGVASRQFFQNRPGVLRTRIIHEEHFVTGFQRLQRGAQSRVQILECRRIPVHRYDHGDARRAGRLVRKSL